MIPAFAVRHVPPKLEAEIGALMRAEAKAGPRIDFGRNALQPFPRAGSVAADILDLVTARGGMTSGDIAMHLRVPQSAVAQKGAALVARNLLVRRPGDAGGFDLPEVAP